MSLPNNTIGDLHFAHDKVRSCFEAKDESEIWEGYVWSHFESHGLKTRPCVGEVVENYSLHYNAPSPSDTTSEDSDDDDSSRDAEDDPRPCLSEEVYNSLHHKASNPDNTTDQELDNDDLSHDAEAIEDEETDNDYDTSSTDSMITPLPNTRPFLSAARPMPAPPPTAQHRQCTNHYFLHPAILSTNSHIHAGATAVLYGANTFHFALDFDNDGDRDGGLSNAPWSKHWDKMKDVHLTQNCAILGRQAPEMQKRRRNAMTIADRDHWGDEEVRDDLCGIINALPFLKRVGTRFQRLRLELGNLVRGEGKVKVCFAYIVVGQLSTDGNVGSAIHSGAVRSVDERVCGIECGQST